MIYPMAEPSEQPDFTVQQLARRWQVTERAVQKWISEGAFPNAYRVGLGRGSHYRVPASDVQEFERARKVHPS